MIIVRYTNRQQRENEKNTENTVIIEPQLFTAVDGRTKILNFAL